MDEKHEKQQEPSAKESPETASEKSKNTMGRHTIEEASPSRPRELQESERVVQRGREKAQIRQTRELMKTREVQQPVRPIPSVPNAIQRHPRTPPVTQTTLAKETSKRIETSEDRELVKMAAWAALFISLVSLILVINYSRRVFGPEFEFYDLKTVQKNVVTDVKELKYDTHLEKIKMDVLNANFQILVRKDYKTAEAELENAKDELELLINSLPIEKSVEPKEILSSIDRIIREIRRGPSTLDDRFKSVLENIENIATNQ